MGSFIKTFLAMIGLILIGWFLTTHFDIKKIDQKTQDRLSNLEDSVSRLNTQGYIGKSLEKTKKR